MFFKLTLRHRNVWRKSGIIEGDGRLRNKLVLVLFGFVLALFLVACGKSNEEKVNTIVEAEADEPAETEIEVGNQTEEVDESAKDSYTIGLTPEEFKTNFNESAEKRQLEMTIDAYEWEEVEDGFRVAELFEDGDVYIFALIDGDNEELKSVLLEVYGGDSRQVIFDMMKAMIESINPEHTEDLDGIMAELDLIDPEKAGEDREVVTERNGLKYLFRDDVDNYIEFAIAHEDDGDLGIDE